MTSKSTGVFAFYGAGLLGFAISAAATVRMSGLMSGGMPMSGGWTMSMVWMRMLGQSLLGAGSAFLGMWLLMMMAMMLPSAIPMLLSYRPAFHGPGDVKAGVPIFLMACGYFLVWLAIGAPVYLLGGWLATAAMRWEALSRAAPRVAGVVVILSGCVQFTSWKLAYLGRCRSPQSCRIAAGREWSRGFTTGLRCGLNCAICCSGLMLIQLAIGVMNLTSMVVVAALITVEKLLPGPERVVQVSGLIAIIAGIVIGAGVF